VDVSFQTSTAFEVDLYALGGVVIRAGFATAHHLAVEEVAQPAPSPVAILNLTGWCSFADRDPAGLCVMAVGRGEVGELLWAACLRAIPGEDDPAPMVESLLIAPEVVGRTRRVALLAYGGRFGADNQSGLPPNSTGRTRESGTPWDCRYRGDGA
jgi:hypothetical protein